MTLKLFSPPQSTPSHAPRHVFLDIDGTLATSYPPHRYQTQNHLDDYRDAAEYRILETPHAHVLHPGAIEFLQYIVQNFETVSFFSSASATRNQPLIRELLILAFGAERYDSLKDKIKIHSRNQMTDFCKDLIGLTTDLNNAILIDDKPFMAAKGQKRNLLFTHGADEHDLIAMHYHTNNNRYLQNHVYVNTILRVNHLFYVTGLLKRVLESNHKSIVHGLRRLQFQLSEDKRHELNFAMHNDTSIYREGLAELRKFNPQLTFFGGMDAEGMLAAPTLHEVSTQSSLKI